MIDDIATFAATCSVVYAIHLIVDILSMIVPIATNYFQVQLQLILVAIVTLTFMNICVQSNISYYFKKFLKNTTKDTTSNIKGKHIHLQDVLQHQHAYYVFMVCVSCEF